MRFCRLARAGLLCGTALMVVSSVRGDTIRLTHEVDGYTGVRDAVIYSDGGSIANGRGDSLFSGRNSQGFTRRSLIRFDLESAGLPSAIEVTGVELTFHVSQTNATRRTVSLHRLLDDWGEGAEDPSGAEGQGATAEPGSATWTDRFHLSSTWSSVGADFDPTSSATAMAPLSGAVTWSSLALIRDVQSWVDGEDNFGWIVIGDESEPSTAIRYVSSNHDEGAPVWERPTLLIEYEVIPAPASALALLMAGGCLSRRRSRHNRSVW